MIFCAAGDIHGALDQLYRDVLDFEQSLAIQFDWVLHVGDFGVWPDADRVDRATRDHDAAVIFVGGIWRSGMHREKRYSSRETTKISFGLIVYQTAKSYRISSIYPTELRWFWNLRLGTVGLGLADTIQILLFKQVFFGIAVRGFLDDIPWPKLESAPASRLSRNR
jgi:hypothetical protein